MREGEEREQDQFLQLNLVKYPFHRTELVNPTIRVGILHGTNTWLCMLTRRANQRETGGLGYGGFYLMGKGVYYDKGKVFCCCLEWEMYIE